MGNVKYVNRVLVRNSEGKRPLGRCRCDGKIILKWILNRENGRVWTGIIWLRIGISDRLL
jgi:hypothetical protein